MSDSNKGNREQTVGPTFAILAAIVIISLIVGVLSYSQGVETERRDDTPAAYAEAAKKDALRTCREGEAAAVFECVYETVESSQQQAQAEQDLDAQQSMGFWAAIMAAIAFGSLLLTGATVWLIKLTLDATAGMLGEAKELTQETVKATHAMIKQNKLTERGQRPWLNFEVLPLMIGADDLWVMSAEVTVTNRTNFPAHGISVAAVGHFFDNQHDDSIRAIEDDRGDVNEILKNRSDFRPPTTAFPNETALLQINHITMHDPGDVLDSGNENLGLITFGLHYFFDGGEGWTFKEYVIAGRPRIDESDQTIRPNGESRITNLFKLHLTEAT